MLIGLAGQKNSGKDTTYELLRTVAAPRKVVRDAFADRMKLVAYRAFCPGASLETALAWGDSLKQRGHVTSFDPTMLYARSGREYLQNFGRAHRETFGEDFWLDLVLGVSENYLGALYGRDDVSEEDLLVITDVRMPNEADRIRDLGGTIWHIERAGLPDDADITEQRLTQHLFDRVLYNDSTIDFLRLQVHEAYMTQFEGVPCA